MEESEEGCSLFRQDFACLVIERTQYSHTLVDSVDAGHFGNVLLADIDLSEQLKNESRDERKQTRSLKPNTSDS